VNNFVRTVLVPVLVKFEILINITFLFNLLITRIRKFAALTLLCSNLIVCCAV